MNVVLAQATNDSSIRNVHVERPGTIGWSLKWRLRSALFYLVVEAPLGGDVSVDQEVIDVLSNAIIDATHSRHEFPLAGGRSCMVYLKPRIKERQYEYTRSHERYAVYGCGFDIRSNELTVYLPQTAEDAACDVSGTITSTVAPNNVTETTGFGPWQKTETRRDGYKLRLDFDSKPAPNERLDVWYEFPGSPFRYPVLPAMNGKTFYVKSPTGSDDAPLITSGGTGYSVVEAR